MRSSCASTSPTHSRRTPSIPKPLLASAVPSHDAATSSAKSSATSTAQTRSATAHRASIAPRVSSLDSALRAHASLAARRAASTDDDAFAFAFDAFFDVDPSSSSVERGRSPRSGRSASTARATGTRARRRSGRSRTRSPPSAAVALSPAYIRVSSSPARTRRRERSRWVLASAFSLSFSASSSSSSSASSSSSSSFSPGHAWWIATYSDSSFGSPVVVEANQLSHALRGDRSVKRELPQRVPQTVRDLAPARDGDVLVPAPRRSRESTASGGSRTVARASRADTR